MSEISKKFLSGQPIIAQLISLIPDDVFNQAVTETQTDRYYKQMKTRDHFIYLFYAVLTRNSSLREVCKNITLIAKKLLYVRACSASRHGRSTPPFKFYDEKHV